MKLPLAYHVDSKRIRILVYNVRELEQYSGPCIWSGAMLSHSMNVREQENVLLKDGDLEVKYEY